MDAFGLAGGALSLVAVSENVTFRVDGVDGDAYVLRLRNLLDPHLRGGTDELYGPAGAIHEPAR